MIVLAVVLSLCAAQASAYSFNYAQQPDDSTSRQLLYVYENAMVAQPVSPEAATAGLPCASAGFFTHPTNCTRFYRCVDYAGTGSFFSTYEFVCPFGNVFVTEEIDTCVPGDCSEWGAVPVGSAQPVDTAPSGGSVQPVDTAQSGGSVQPVDTAQSGGSVASVGAAQDGSVQPVTYPPAVEVVSESAVPDGAPAGSVDGVGSQTDQTDPISTSGNVYPPPSGPLGDDPNQGGPPPTDEISGTEGGSAAVPAPDATVPEAGVTDGSAVGSQVTGEECAKSYVQDDTFCNIYRACPDDGKRYLCQYGSVFNEAQQLCDLDTNVREQVCMNKQFQEKSSLRTTLDGNLFLSNQPGLSGTLFYASPPGVQQPRHQPTAFYPGHQQPMVYYSVPQQQPFFYSPFSFVQ